MNSFGSKVCLPLLEMHKRNYFLMAIIAYFVWGTTFPFSKMVIPPLTSIGFVFFRSLMGFIFLFGIIIFTNQAKSFYITLKANWWQLALLSLIPYCFSYVLQFYAIQFTTPINQSIIAQTSIIWVVIMNFLFFKQKPKLKFIFGVIIAIVGVILLLTNDEFELSPENLKGDVLSIIAFISWASYSVFSKPVSQKMNSLHAITAVFLYGTLFLLPLALYQQVFLQTISFNWEQWVILLFLGFICTGLAYYFHLKSMTPPEIRSDQIVYFGLMMPIISTIFTLLTSDETLTWRIVLGGCLVLISVAVVLYKPKKRKEIIPNDDSN